MSAHTPGPWVSHSAEGQEQLRDTAFVVTPFNASAVVLAEVKFHPIQREAGAIAEANARLIAAAPDLLAEFETAVRIIEEAKPGSFDNGNSYAGCDEGDALTHRWLEKARALIANLGGDS